MTDREQELTNVLLGLRERGTPKSPCWCRDKDYNKKGKHMAYCLLAQAVVKGTK
jgi:hypothetical protein